MGDAEERGENENGKQKEAKRKSISEGGSSHSERKGQAEELSEKRGKKILYFYKVLLLMLGLEVENGRAW